MNLTHVRTRRTKERPLRRPLWQRAGSNDCVVGLQTLHVTQMGPGYIARNPKTSVCSKPEAWRDCFCWLSLPAGSGSMGYAPRYLRLHSDFAVPCDISSRKSGLSSDTKSLNVSAWRAPMFGSLAPCQAQLQDLSVKLQQAGI